MSVGVFYFETLTVDLDVNWGTVCVCVSSLHVLNFAWPSVRIHYPDNTAGGHRLAPF